MKIKFRKIGDGFIPKRATHGAAGFDIYSTRHAEIWPHGGQAVIPAGFAMEIPEGWAGVIKPRSGLATRHKVNVHAGLIDSDYRGEVRACLINHGDRVMEIKRGERIAQLIVVPVLTDHVVVDELSHTARGNGGFGSTGRN